MEEMKTLEEPLLANTATKVKKESEAGVLNHEAKKGSPYRQGILGLVRTSALCSHSSKWLHRHVPNIAASNSPQAQRIRPEHGPSLSVLVPQFGRVVL